MSQENRAVVIEEGVGGLREAAGSNGRAMVDIITPGWGSSGYYSEEMLRRDGPVAFPSGTHMYLDHPTLSDEHERPERSVNDLAAVTEADASWDAANGSLSAPVTLFPDHREAIKAKAQAIGVSIRAHGEMEEGDADGESGNIITALTEGLSADFVTKAGRGGKIAEILESHRPAPEGDTPVRVYLGDKEITEAVRIEQDVPVSTTESRSDGGGKEGRMSDEDKLSEFEERLGQQETKIGELEESANSEKERADRAEDALALERARNIVNEALEAEVEEGEDALPELPERARERVREAALKGKLPLDEEENLDKDKLIERVHKAVREEAEYLGGGGNSGQVQGMGVAESAAGTGNGNGGGGNGDEEVSEADKQRLIEAFKRQGMSEEAAKVAAEGR